MTSAQTMLNSDAHPLWGGRFRTLAAAVLAVITLTGCSQAPKEKLVAPRTMVAPYDTSRGDVLWAVVPLRNESGTSVVDTLEVSDKVVAAASQIRGVRTLPLNRTIATMRALNMPGLQTPADAKRLATEMGVDALLVGSITAWDPYDPPTLGLALALYARPGSMDKRGEAQLDTRKLEFQPTDYQYFARSSFDSAPASVVSEYMDGKNHQVLMEVKSYAEGRHDPSTALGYKRYLASMDLYVEFGGWQTVSRLLDQEWVRLARVPGPTAKK